MKNVVMPAFSELGFNHLVEKLGQCGEFINYIECKNCKTKHYAGFSRCKDRFCVNCMRIKAQIWLAKILERLGNLLADYNVSMLNLTIRDGPLLCERLDFIEKSWRNLYNKNKLWSKIFKIRVKGGVRSLEVKRGKNSGEWHPHYHILILTPKGRYVKDFYWIRRAWKQITKGEGSVFIKKIGNEKQEVIKGVIEVVKYIFKPEKTIFENVEDLKEIYTELKGKRQINTFGIMRTKESEIETELDDIEEKKLAKFICQLCGGKEGLLKSDLYRKLKEELLLDIE